MNDIYQRITIAGEQEDSRKILAILAEIQAGRLENDLKLVNYFRQVPVSYPAQVLTVEPDSALPVIVTAVAVDGDVGEIASELGASGGVESLT